MERLLRQLYASRQSYLSYLVPDLLNYYIIPMTEHLLVITIHQRTCWMETIDRRLFDQYWSLTRSDLNLTILTKDHLWPQTPDRSLFRLIQESGDCSFSLCRDRDILPGDPFFREVNLIVFHRLNQEEMRNEPSRVCPDELLNDLCGYNFKPVSPPADPSPPSFLGGLSSLFFRFL